MHILPVTALQGWSTTSFINSIYENVQKFKIWKDKIQIIKSSCKNTLCLNAHNFHPFMRLLPCKNLEVDQLGGNGMLDMRQEFQAIGKSSFWIID